MASPLQLNVINFTRNAYITIEGKATDNCFYIIRSGNVSITKEAYANEVETLKPGDFFSVVSAMSNHSHIETAIALSDVSAISVHSEQFPLLIQKNNPVAMKIILSFSRKLRELDKELTELTLKSVSAPYEDVVNLFDIGEFYLRQKQYNQAFYAFYRFVQYCPNNELVINAKEYLADLKEKAKAVYLDDKAEFKRIYPDNTMLCCEHEPGDELFIIQSGKIKVTKMIDNKEVLLAVLKEGDIFGEMALLESKPRSASGIAYGDTTVMAVNKDKFQTMISSQPQMITKIISLLAERTWVLYRQLANLKLRSDIGRTYDTLLIHLEKNRVPIKKGISHNFDFGPNELIDMVGLDKVKGRDIVQEIFKNKKFQLVDNKIVVADIDEIQRQVSYYKKMEILEDKRKSSHKSF
ncbi:MAG: cyclic nucleotide-binding domain-containing protein [Spirochaetes bacterium]|nr:cyclic nucleotide-binding domain-containing protein [Spirochaetota bacterium]